MWVKEVLEGKGFVEKGCWKWGVREKGHGDLERWCFSLSDRWREVEMAPFTTVPFPSHSEYQSTKLFH